VGKEFVYNLNYVLMEITITQSKIIKTLAILMMLCLHLFNRSYEGLFTPVLFIGEQPITYYISLFSDACVPIFLFISGYGLFYNYQKDIHAFVKSNGFRLFKLYINYWLVVLLFAVVLGLLLGKEGYPGSLIKFILNFIGLENSYNGAWWFFFTYILLTLTAPLLFKILELYSTWLILTFVMLFYFVSFYFRVYNNDLFTNPYLAWFFRQIYLFGTSLFPFIFGALVMQKKWHTHVNNLFAPLKYKSLIAILGICTLIFIHGIIPNFIIAPFLAIPFIFLWNQISLGEFLERFLLWLSGHATNLWLVHMFFYITYFETFIYSPKYPILIFANLLFWSVVASHSVNILYKPLINLLNQYKQPRNETTLYNQRN
jgi:surface polysaccharide O-acyltransferase-like enzyme